MKCAGISQASPAADRPPETARRWSASNDIWPSTHTTSSPSMTTPSGRSAAASTRSEKRLRGRPPRRDWTSSGPGVDVVLMEEDGYRISLTAAFAR
ncbi:hypothetical protein GCM10017752_00270 [Streptomyces roseoviridis]